MSSVPNVGTLLPRRRGPKGKFASKDAQIALLAFLSDASKSNLDAAAHFGCSQRTIEYALARIRAEIQKKGRTPTTSSDPDQVIEVIPTTQVQDTSAKPSGFGS